MRFDAVFMFCWEEGWALGSWSRGRDLHVRQVPWQLRLLSCQPVSPGGRVFFWWLHEPCFPSRSAHPLQVFCWESFLEEWSGSVAQKSLNLLVSQHAVLYFSRNFFMSVSALQLSISCLALISPLPSLLREGVWCLKFGSQRQNHCWPWQGVCRMKTFLGFSPGPAPAQLLRTHGKEPVLVHVSEIGPWALAPRNTATLFSLHKAQWCDQSTFLSHLICMPNFFT